MSRSVRRHLPSLPLRPRSVIALGMFAGILVAPTAAHAVAKPVPSGGEVIDPRLINVKFRDDTSVSVAGSKVVLGNSDAQARLSSVLGAGNGVAGPVFAEAPSALDAKRSALEAAGKSLPDLTAWVEIKLDSSVDPKVALAKLQADPLVEYAYVVPKLTVQSLTSTEQTDLDTKAAKFFGTGASGINITGAAAIPGALGDNVDVADIEYDSRPDHADLLRPVPSVDQWYGPTTPGSGPNADHGTSVAGVIAAKRDGVGTDGVAPNARVHLVSPDSTALPAAPSGSTGSSARAVYAAADRLAPGSVLLIELGNEVTGALEVGDPSATAAITWATAQGVIVVEAAANRPLGGKSYDSAEFAGTSVAPGGPDSGAIIVGAGGVTDCVHKGIARPARTRMDFSFYGSRVDVQGPGACVPAPVAAWDYTTDYIDWSTNAAYFPGFSGTSSATAVMAGVVASLSGAYEKKVGVPLTPALARATLKAAANSQAQDTSINPGNIGPLPNLVSAINAIAVPDTTAPSQPGAVSTANGGTYLSLGWGASTDNVGVTHYDVVRNGVPYDQLRTTNFWDPKTVPGTVYTYAIYAVDLAGNRSVARNVTLTAAAGTVPTDAIAPGATPVSAALDATTPKTKVNLTWPSATDNVGVDYYEVKRDGIYIGEATGTSYADTTVKPGRYHTYSVTTVDNAGNRSTPGRTTGIVTAGPRADLVAPVLPNNPNVSNSGNTVLIGLFGATDAVGVRSYDIERSTSPSGPFTPLTQTVVPTYRDTSVAPSTSYTYRVYAVDAAGNRSVPKAGTVTTPAFTASTDTVKPTAPGATSPTLTGNIPLIGWTAGADNVAVTSYELRRNGLFAGSTTYGPSADNGATPGRYATYGVIAIDAAGNRSPLNGPKGIAPTP